MNEFTFDTLTQLGEMIELPESPEHAVLEKVDNPHSSVDYHIRLTCPEFTSLCPKTGQPDFAHLVIDYIPRLSILESKSLKLYLHRCFVRRELSLFLNFYYSLFFYNYY